jgi:hypothetical protein
VARWLPDLAPSNRLGTAAMQQNGERATSGTSVIIQQSSFIYIDSADPNSSSVTPPLAQT